MIATSAWGMGIGDPDIERVIQWGDKRLENLYTVIQRFRRAGRNPELYRSAIYRTSCTEDETQCSRTCR